MAREVIKCQRYRGGAGRGLLGSVYSLMLRAPTRCSPVLCNGHVESKSNPPKLSGIGLVEETIMAQTFHRPKLPILLIATVGFSLAQISPSCFEWSAMYYCKRDQ